VRIAGGRVPAPAAPASGRNWRFPRKLTVKAFLRLVFRGWAPQSHWLHPAKLRAAVGVMLHVAHRLEHAPLEHAAHAVGVEGRQPIESAVGASEPGLPYLPTELWSVALTFLTVAPSVLAAVTPPIGWLGLTRPRLQRMQSPGLTRPRLQRMQSSGPT
jgi:hypothetical protein